jgi:HNH endonuclease
MEHQKTAKDYIYWHSTVEPDGCWSWDLKGRTKDGYAFGTWPPKKRKTAHRIAYEAYHGPVPPGLFVLHKCDRRDCVNPEHLYAGTQSNNVQDALKRGRWSNGR